MASDDCEEVRYPVDVGIQSDDAQCSLLNLFSTRCRIQVHFRRWPCCLYLPVVVDVAIVCDVIRARIIICIITSERESCEVD